MLLKDVLAVWRKLASDTRHKSEQDRLAYEMEMLRSQSMAHIALVLQTIFNEHTTGLSRITFAGWRDILAALKAENEHDALRKQMSAAQAKADLYKERALQA